MLLDSNDVYISHRKSFEHYENALLFLLLLLLFNAALFDRYFQTVKLEKVRVVALFHV